MTDASVPTPVDSTETADVAIVGAGPAGLMLAHWLDRAGIDVVNIDTRTREEIETTHRAGILEADAARDLVETGVSDRILRDGYEHEGTYLRFGGQSHHINFKELVGQSVWLYPQTDVFIDLVDARARDGGRVHFGVTDPAVAGETTERPTMSFTGADGNRTEADLGDPAGARGRR